MCVRRFAVDNRTLFPYNMMCDCQSEVRSMNAKEKIEELLEASEDGTITAAQVTEAGLPVSYTHLDVYKRQIMYFARRRLQAATLALRLGICRSAYPPGYTSWRTRCLARYKRYLFVCLLYCAAVILRAFFDKEQ